MSRNNRPKRRRDPGHLRHEPPQPGHDEVSAVQLEQAGLVQTTGGQAPARAGDWLVTEADGTIHVVTDRVFRLQMLRQQLLRVLARSQPAGRKRA